MKKIGQYLRSKKGLQCKKYTTENTKKRNQIYKVYNDESDNAKRTMDKTKTSGG